MIICICGKSGSGKSTVARLIQKNRPNSILVDIDKIGHMSHSDKLVKQKLVDTFGEIILTANNIDRKKLGQIVFSSKEEMKKLEIITWGYMEQEIDKIIESNKDKIIILDYLLLPRTKYFNNCDLRILVDIPYEIRKERVIKRDNISEEKFNLRESSSIDYDKNNFDIVLKNEEMEDIKRKVLKYE